MILHLTKIKNIQKKWIEVMKNINSHIGEKHNLLTIIAPSKKDKDGSFRVVCLCECGKKKDVLLYKVLNGKIKSCGCYKHYLQRKEMIGKTFNNLKCLRFVEIRNKKAFFEFQCVCGKHKILHGSSVKTGVVKSCGCLHRTQGGLTKKHKTLWTLYQNMKKRCLDPSNPQYKNYGGRGISICKRWQDSFEDFVEDILNSIGDRPTINHSLDRIDNDGDYCVDNVRWATRTEQNINKRTKNQEMRNINKRGKKYRVKVGRYGVVLMSHNIDSLERALEIRSIYRDLLETNKYECRRIKEQNDYPKE